MKKALLALSYGVSEPSAARGCILPVEQALAKAFPDRELRRAYTSRPVLRKLAEKGVCIPGEAEALGALCGEGYKDILIASTHIIPGGQYALAAETAGDLRISEPLLANEDDLHWMAGLLGALQREEHRVLMVMAHGADQTASEIYARLRRMLPKGVLLGCTEGALRLDAILPELEALPERRVTLTPMMLTAGRHALRDLAGEHGSWKSLLESRGFDVRVRMRGLGELEIVQQRFVAKARKCLEN